VDRIGFYSFHETLFYLQKMCVAVLVLIAFRTLDPQRLKWLSPFADAAFSIYFLHVFFMLVVAELAFTFVVDESFLPASMYLMTVVHFFAALALSLLTVHLFRKAFGRRSRLLIGS
jgi:peptidoglycan/LPS O-acetylase OafA/YrhL